VSAWNVYLQLKPLLYRINWMGTALNAFYASVRKALVLVIVLRAIGILLAGGYVAWWILTS
jgi:hypothetical protein